MTGGGSRVNPAFRPVPGLGASHMQFPMAHAMGYFRVPSMFDSSKVKVLFAT